VSLSQAGHRPQEDLFILLIASLENLVCVLPSGLGSSPGCEEKGGEGHAQLTCPDKPSCDWRVIGHQAGFTENGDPGFQISVLSAQNTSL
jgi:hypothetical protein